MIIYKIFCREFSYDFSDLPVGCNNGGQVFARFKNNEEKLIEIK